MSTGHWIPSSLLLYNLVILLNLNSVDDGFDNDNDDFNDDNDDIEDIDLRNDWHEYNNIINNNNNNIILLW